MKRWITLLFIGLLIGATGCRKDGKYKVRKNHRQSVGSSAEDLLSKRKYKSIKIEIIYMTGYKPTEEAVSNLMDLIVARCNKPNGVSLKYTEIAAQNKSSYSLSDVKTIEDDSRTEFTAHKELAVTFIFLDGPSADNQGSGVILGEAYYNTSLVIFEETVQEYSDGFGEPERYKLETLILNHEFGHILGLVNVGSKMQTDHQDNSHTGHCSNSSCLMFWEAETGGAINNLLGSNPIPTFDANCISDLQGNGGK